MVLWRSRNRLLMSSLKKGEEHNELGQSLTDISFAASLTRIGARQATRAPRAPVDGQRQWRSGAGSATEFLSRSARGGGAPDSMIDVRADTLVGGVTLPRSA